MGKNIDQITRTLTTLTGAERMAVRDGSGDAKAVIETALLDYITSGVLDTYVKNYIESGAVDDYVKAKGEPIGTIKDWDKTLSGTPALDATWHECDGSMIDDADSPYDGQRIRNLNGADVILTGIVWASGVATIPSADLPALAVGDYVAGSGIDSEAYITDITGTTVTMSDTSFSDTVTTTFSNDGRFVGGGETSGDGKRDNVPNVVGIFYTRKNQADSPVVFASSIGAIIEDTDITTTLYDTIQTSTPQKYRTRLKFDAKSYTGLGATKYTSENSVHPIHTKMVKIIKIKDTL